MANGTEPRSGRETRLLVLVVAVAVAVLLLLARWRFPGSDLSVVTPSAAPLAGLAARATFDEMANTMADVIGRVSPLTVVVELDPADPDDSRARGQRSAVTGSAPDATRPVVALALRVRRDLALVHVPEGLTPRNTPETPVNIAAHDTSREIMLIRVAPTIAAPDTLSASVRTFPGFAYVAAVDATSVGPTIQPVFIGRADSVMDPRWSHPLIPASIGTGLTPGTLIFALNSRLAGMVVQTQMGAMIVPAPALETLVQALEAGSQAP